MRVHTFCSPPAYLGLGDNEQAFAGRERGYQAQSQILKFLKVHPFFDPLRDDLRFKDLVRRVGDLPFYDSPRMQYTQKSFGESGRKSESWTSATPKLQSPSTNGCLQRRTETQCLSCSRWSPDSDWYAG